MRETASETRSLKTTLLASLRRNTRRTADEWRAIFAAVARDAELLAEVRTIFRGQQQ
jgi:hypothetical protein